MIELNIEGLDAIRETFKRLVPEVKQQVLNGMAQVAFDTAQRQVDTHTQTGALARSLRLRPDGDSAWIVDHNLQHAPHAIFVHFGTRPHEIKARDKQALKFVGKDGLFHFWWGPKTPQERAIIMQWMKKKAAGGRAHFRWPRHPGYAGDPYLVTAADAAVRAFDSIVRRVSL